VAQCWAACDLEQRGVMSGYAGTWMVTRITEAGIECTERKLMKKARQCKLCAIMGRLDLALRPYRTLYVVSTWMKASSSGPALPMTNTTRDSFPTNSLTPCTP